MKRLIASFLIATMLVLSVALIAERPSSAQSVNVSGKIAFTTDRDRSLNIYVMNADGSNPVALTKNATDNYFPTRSPAADKIAFTSTREGNPEICVMNADGGNQTCLTHKPDPQS